MGKDAARDAAGAITAAGVASIAAGSVPNPASPALLPAGISACLLQASLLAGLATWDTFVSLSPDPDTNELAVATGFSFEPVAANAPAAPLLNSTLSVAATLVSDSRAASSALAKWTAASRGGAGALAAVHASCARGWLTRVDGGKLLLGAQCTQLSTQLATDLPAVSVSRDAVMAERGSFLAGRIPPQEQQAFEIMGATSAEMAAVRSEVELMTGESLPPTVTMSSALALVAPALSQVVLAELMPAGFQYTPAGCGSSVITLERTVTPATDIAVRPATDVAANTAVGAGRPIAIS